MNKYLFKEIIGEDRIYKNSTLVVEQGNISGIEQDLSNNTIDYSEYYAIPGIIDIHNHGYMGWSAFSKEPEHILSYLKALTSAGVTGVLPTVYELESLSVIVKAKKVKDAGAEILGIHAEGPFLNPDKRGAFSLESLEKPSIKRVKEYFNAAEGILRIMTIAPDIDNAKQVISWLKEHHIIASAGHTLANYRKMTESFKWGISSITHLGNAMSGITHRDIGSLGASILDKNVNCELIADFHHVSKEMIELVLSVKEKSKITLISDSAQLAGCKPGKYKFDDRGGFVIMNEDGSISLEDGTIAGSGKNILYGIKKLVKEIGLNLSDVIQMASINQAELLDIDSSKGSIKTGKDADFVVIDEDFNVVATYIKGEKVFEMGMEQALLNSCINPLS